MRTPALRVSNPAHDQRGISLGVTRCRVDLKQSNKHRSVDLVIREIPWKRVCCEMAKLGYPEYGSNLTGPFYFSAGLSSHVGLGRNLRMQCGIVNVNHLADVVVPIKQFLYPLAPCRTHAGS